MRVNFNLPVEEADVTPPDVVLNLVPALNKASIEAKYPNIARERRRPFLVSGFVHGHSGLIAAPSGVGKSLLEVSQLLALARDAGTWGGTRTAHGCVLVMAYEDGCGLMLNLRASATLLYPTEAEEILSRIRVIDAEGGEIRVPKINTIEGVNFVIEQVKELEAETGRDCVAVYVDTLAKSATGIDISSSKDATAYEESLDLIRRKTGATTVLLAHTPKGNGDTIKGAGEWYDQSASVVMLKAKNAELRLYVDKYKNGKRDWHCWVTAPLFRTPAHVKAWFDELTGFIDEDRPEDKETAYDYSNEDFRQPTLDGRNFRAVIPYFVKEADDYRNAPLWGKPALAAIAPQLVDVYETEWPFNGSSVNVNRIKGDDVNVDGLNDDSEASQPSNALIVWQVLRDRTSENPADPERPPLQTEDLRPYLIRHMQDRGYKMTSITDSKQKALTNTLAKLVSEECAAVKRGKFNAYYALPKPPRDKKRKQQPTA